MNNHYRWVLETPEANLVRGMQWFQNTYTRRFNQRHRLWGHVFGSRYKEVVVESDRAAARGVLLASNAATSTLRCQRFLSLPGPNAGRTS